MAYISHNKTHTKVMFRDNIININKQKLNKAILFLDFKAKTFKTSKKDYYLKLMKLGINCGELSPVCPL